MTIFLLIIMALLLIVALEITDRRQPPRAPGLHGARDRDDRDWARIKLDLVARGDEADAQHSPKPSIGLRRTIGSSQGPSGISRI